MLAVCFCTGHMGSIHWPWGTTPRAPPTPTLPPWSSQSHIQLVTLLIPSSRTWLRQDNFPLIPANLLLLLKLVKSFLAKPFWPEFLLSPAELL